MLLALKRVHMANEEMLYALLQDGDPNSRLVAEDLAMELNCGLPSVRSFGYTLTNGCVSMMKYKRAIDNVMRASVGQKNKLFSHYTWKMAAEAGRFNYSYALYDLDG